MQIGLYRPLIAIFLNQISKKRGMSDSDPKEFLTEWLVRYLKNKDLLLRSIVSIERDKEGADVFVEFKDKKQHFIVCPFIRDLRTLIQGLDQEKHITWVVFNTAENFRGLLDGWKELAEFRHFSMYFVNPFSTMDKRWIIFPYTHERISDKASLETGLKALFDSVEMLTEKTVLNHIATAAAS